MDHDESIETIKTFLSGKMTAEEFWEIYKSSKIIQNIMIGDEERRGFGGAYYCASALLQNIKNIHSYYDSAGLHTAVKVYFLRNRIPAEMGAVSAMADSRRKTVGIPKTIERGFGRRAGVLLLLRSGYERGDRGDAAVLNTVRFQNVKIDMCVV